MRKEYPPPLPFHDPANAHVLQDLVTARVESLAGHPALNISRQKYFVTYNFLVGDEQYAGVQVTRDHKTSRIVSCRITLIDGHERIMDIIDTYDELVMMSPNPGLYDDAVGERYADMVARAIERLSNGSVNLQLGTPYAYADYSGVVTTLFWGWLGRHKISGSSGMSGQLYQQTFVLEGHDLIPELTDVPEYEVSPASFWRRFWGFVEAGQIINLGDRLKLHPGNLWYLTSGVSWPHLLFDAQDEGLPFLPAGTPYFYRSPKDPTGGDLPRTRQLVAQILADYQGSQPINVSDSFRRGWGGGGRRRRR